ncbi:hypothetical protein KIN20_026560 [Parelaphostrongylus tenuis]|uniref:Uncharacterized protein n=1 Tax=Parelaphostrongylus tenuis TaxID=148309 RepID=A0AAD5QY57_PARTN|nr:hypothetical protein KIN20_026560 [Parelaphostrongylus tenuis]
MSVRSNYRPCMRHREHLTTVSRALLGNIIPPVKSVRIKFLWLEDMQNLFLVISSKMTNLAGMAKVSARSFVMPLFIITAVLGCGTLPGGPAAMSSRTFNVSGFSLPVAMAFTSAPGAAAQVANISTGADVARGFVMRTIMQAVFDVLEQQGRAAGLSDFIITSILNQLNVTINYTPLECKDVAVNHAMPAEEIRGNQFTAHSTNSKCEISKCSY